MSRQAVVILHGMGEQIPMQTLNSFVRSVWTTDETLVARGRPDPRTGGPRTENASWSKPDDRNTSTELRRITTESDIGGNYTDFYEFYWAHLMRGTTLEHVRAWIWDLLLRNPFRRVPRRVLHAWVALWVVALIVLAVTVSGMLPGRAPDTAARVLAGWVLGLGVAAFVSNVLIKRFGDVARYVEARPPNVARRQEIRAQGVDLLDALMKSPDYDRIVVVAHSLGAIVAYDVLAMLYARYNSVTDGGGDQPERHALEEMVRRAAGLPTADGTEAPPEPLDLDAFQAQQAATLAEAQTQGNPWRVTDFITIGAPLAHAEFLMADSLDDLRARQNSRLLPTCPPVLEFDGVTKLRHMSYDPAQARNRTPTEHRVLHHAAPFAVTRWTNLYSDERWLVTGDIISGPVSEVFGMQVGGRVVSGIRDIAVLPRMEGGRVARGHRRPFFTHQAYWDMRRGSELGTAKVPHHVAELRKALGLLR